jgi:AmmeMemoRadiSam system protein B
MARIKHSHLAGTWYAGDAAGLRAQVDELLQTGRRDARATGPLCGLVVPHAGYIYSGRAAASAYAGLTGAPYGRVVILAPSHFAAFRGVAVLAVDGFETPIGVVSVDTAQVAALAQRPLFREDAQPYREEHALEIQLPFVQRVLPGARIVPTLFGALTAADYLVVAETLRELSDTETIFIVSSDFVHYGARFGYLPFPAAGRDVVRVGLRRLDLGAIERVCAGDPVAFRAYVDETGATICGRIPIAAFLTLHQQRTHGELLAYYTSLDVTGDYQHCVSYASIAFPRA